VKIWLGLCALLLAGAASGAQTYKWVDERGVTNYGETPPTGRPARPVDTQPAGTVESGREQEKRRASDTQRTPDVTPSPVVPIVAPAPAPAAQPVRGMSFQTFIHLRTGMTEAEIVLRAGRPDHESVENFRHDIVKSYYYYPTVADPFITVVTLRGGRVVNLERNRKIF
jgi:hypothetical protein